MEAARSVPTASNVAVTSVLAAPGPLSVVVVAVEGGQCGVARRCYTPGDRNVDDRLLRVDLHRVTIATVPAAAQRRNTKEYKHYSFILSGMRFGSLRIDDLAHVGPMPAYPRPEGNLSAFSSKRLVSRQTSTYARKAALGSGTCNDGCMHAG